LDSLILAQQMPSGAVHPTAQDVGADDVLHRAEDARMTDQRIQPREQ
jgi:hypothetical protein